MNELRHQIRVVQEYMELVLESELFSGCQHFS